MNSSEGQMTSSMLARRTGWWHPSCQSLTVEQSAVMARLVTAMVTAVTGQWWPLMVTVLVLTMVSVVTMGVTSDHSLALLSSEPDNNRSPATETHLTLDTWPWTVDTSSMGPEKRIGTWSRLEIVREPSSPMDMTTMLQSWLQQIIWESVTRILVMVLVWTSIIDASLMTPSSW